MACFVPPQYRHLKWHVIRPLDLEGEPSGWERAEWVNNPQNGPDEGGHWCRWGYCGDFPSLCQARYIGPAIDQDSPFGEA